MSGPITVIETELPHRSGAPLGSTPPLVFWNWATRTWFRFNIFLCWLFLLVVILASPDPIGRKLGMLAVSPIAAILFYFICAAFFMFSSFVPYLKVLAGFAKLVYYRSFSRLIVQPVTVSSPLWH